MVRASQKGSTRDATYAEAVVAEHHRTATVQGVWLVAGRSRMISMDRLIGRTPESVLGTFLPECGYTRRVPRDLRKGLGLGASPVEVTAIRVRVRCVTR